jgi:hypothetical protein
MSKAFDHGSAKKQRAGRPSPSRQTRAKHGKKAEDPGISPPFDDSTAAQDREEVDDDLLDLSTLKAAGALDVFEMPDEEPLPDDRDFWLEADEPD